MLSLVFFVAVFGRVDPVPVWGAGNLAFDNGVQAFMIALMSTLAPRALLRRRLAMTDGPSLILRAVATGVVTASSAAGVAAAIFAASGIAAVPWNGALAFKLLLGAALAAVVTPIGLAAILRRAQ